MRRILTTAVLAAAVAVTTGCSQAAPTPISEKVTKYYEANKELSTGTTAAPRPVAVFLGDSYTAGAGTTSPSQKWTTRLSSAQGWSEVNLARGGTGYLATATTEACGLVRCPSFGEMIPEAVEAKPSIVVVSGGRNDMQFPLDKSQGATVQFYRDLRASLPKARIIAVRPLWDDDKEPGQLSQLAESVKAAVAAVDGEWVDAGQPLEGNPELVVDDGVHPSDKGNAAIFAAVQSALKK